MADILESHYSRASFFEIFTKNWDLRQMVRSVLFAKCCPLYFVPPTRTASSPSVQLSAESATGVPEVATKARSRLVAPTGAVQ